MPGTGYPSGMSRTPWLLLPWLVACESEQVVVAEMERGLRATNDAIQASLVTAELFGQVLAPPDTTLRHATNCGCPCSEKAGNLPFVLTLDYAPEGCLPDSGLLPVVVSGHAVLDWDGASAGVTFDLLTVSGLPISGAPEVEVGASGAETTLRATGPLTVGGTQVELDQELVIDADGLSIDGTAVVDGQEPLALEGVRIPWEGLAPPCPAPTDGTATLRADPEVLIRLGRPGDGVVTVERRSRVSEQTDLCTYRAAAF